MKTYSLSEETCARLDDLLETFVREHPCVEEPGFLREVAVLAGELPRHFRQALHEYSHHEEGPGAMLINALPLDEAKIGMTPNHWKNSFKKSTTPKHDLFFMLVCSSLGDVIAWATQQAGRVLHDICPIQGHENEQLGSGSDAYLEWHTEDAFHPFRADFLGLMCMRNRVQAPTTFSSLERVRLSSREVALLSEPRFTIKPDKAHLESFPLQISVTHRQKAEQRLRSSFEQVHHMNLKPKRIPVLFGDPADPYMRVDPHFMEKVDNPEVQDALDNLVQQIDDNLREVILQPGQILLIDNYRAVHGRKPFRAQFDGTDRWLKRINIARDLRKSRSARLASDCRVIF